jgi:hypothetical protein
MEIQSLKQPISSSGNGDGQLRCSCSSLITFVPFTRGEMWHGLQ